MRIIRTVLATLVVVGAVTAAAAQTGGLRVKVVDQDGKRLPGATVTISHQTGSVKTTSVLTDGDGNAEFPVLRAGSGFSVDVSFPGLSPIRHDEIRVPIGESVVVSIQMIAQLEERVKVVATPDVIDLDQTQTSSKFTAAFISDLPVAGRYYQNVLTLAPGVQDADGDGNPNVHGSRSRDFKTMVAGVSNVDPLTGQWMSRINPNSIEEMEVITAGAGVEFGRAQGGFARIIQKQGSNEHEGVFEFYLRTSVLDGTGTADQSNLPENSFEELTPAVQFSGPLIKDKLWYRLSHEFRNLEVPVNTGTGVVLVTTDGGTHSDQITWQVSPRNKLALQFQADPNKTENLGVSSTTPASASVRTKRNVEQWTLTWTAPYSPKVLVESTAGWQDLNTGTFPTQSGVPNTCLRGEPFLEGAQCFDVQSGATSGSFFRDNDDHRQRFTVSSHATVFGGRFWGMSHTFKLGLSAENERYFRHLERRPSLTFFTRVPTNDDAGDEDPDANTFGKAFARLAVPGTDDVRATGTHWGIYGEDTFRPRENLTFKLGLRIDREEIHSEGRPLQGQQEPRAQLAEFYRLIAPASEGGAGLSTEIAKQIAFTGFEDIGGLRNTIVAAVCQGFTGPAFEQCQSDTHLRINSQDLEFARTARRIDDINLTNTNFSPSLAASWSPWSNNKTVFKASAGRHYNQIPLNIPLIELEPAFIDVAYRVDLGTGEASVGDTIYPKVTVQTVDRGLKTPYQDQFTLTFERELWTETRLSVQYVNGRFRDQIQDDNINLDVGDYGRCVPQTSQSGRPIAPITDPSDPLFGQFPHGGDGILDDCIGDIETVLLGEDGGGDGNDGGRPGGNTWTKQKPDGILDLYVQNPLYADVFRVGNFNTIDYEGWVLELVRRQYRSWELQGSYTWSKTEGDGEDFFQELGDDPSLKGNEHGYQSYDQRHVVKVSATTITPWGIRLGSTLHWESGLPYSVLRAEESFDAVPPDFEGVGAQDDGRTRQRFVTGARNDQRNDSVWTADVRASRELNLGHGMNMQLSAEVFNLFDDGTYYVYNFNPLNSHGQQVNGVNESTRNFGRRWQLGLKLSF